MQSFWMVWLYIVMMLFVFLLFQEQLPKAEKRIVFALLWAPLGVVVWGYWLLRAVSSVARELHARVFGHRRRPALQRRHRVARALVRAGRTDLAVGRRYAVGEVRALLQAPSMEGAGAPELGGAAAEAETTECKEGPMIEYEWTAPGKLPDDHRDDRVVSSLRVSIGPAHVHLRVWNRGKLAGELCVDADDWPEFVSLLGFRPDEGKRVR